MPQLRQIICLLLLLLAAPQAFALNGTIRESGSNAPVRGVSVMNKKTREYSYTDSNGRFQLSGSVGDSFLLSARGYVFSQEAAGSEDVTWYLLRQSQQLEEVVITTEYTKYQADSAERAQIYQKTLTDAGRKISFDKHNPLKVDGIFSKLAYKASGKEKKDKAFRSKLQGEEQERFTAIRYSTQLTRQLTGLQGDELAHFMNAYPMSYEYARTATDLELKAWIRSNFKEWQEASQRIR